MSFSFSLELFGKIDSIDTTLEETIERVDGIKLKVNELAAANEQSHNTSVQESSISSQCLVEMSDRISRKHNVIIFGCPETIDDDKLTYKEVLASLNVRRQRGETNIKIKVVRGKPKLVELKAPLSLERA